MLTQRLFAVPPPLFLEAPSSWLPRVALSQAETLNGVKRFLGFPKDGDADVKFISMQPQHTALSCGLDAGAFHDVHRVLKLALSLQMEHPLLLYEKGAPRYRFCVECMKEMRTPFFPIHWRFDTYRMCVVHQSVLEDACPHCAGQVCPLKNWAACGPHRGSHTFASQCTHCAKFLWDMTPLKVKTIPRRLLSKHERIRMTNGRAFVSALFHEQVVVSNHEAKDVRTALPFAEKAGMLASGTELRAGYFRKHMTAMFGNK